jgi:hypothetical protein
MHVVRVGLPEPQTPEETDLAAIACRDTTLSAFGRYHLR